MIQLEVGNTFQVSLTSDTFKQNVDGDDMWASPGASAYLVVHNTSGSAAIYLVGRAETAVSARIVPAGEVRVFGHYSQAEAIANISFLSIVAATATCSWDVLASSK